MTKFFTTAAAALFATVAVAATTVPANAGGSFGFSIGGGHGFHDHHGGGVYFGFNDGPSHGSWRRHVRWCFNHYASYNPNTNRYFNGHRWKVCNSPFI